MCTCAKCTLFMINQEMMLVIASAQSVEYDEPEVPSRSSELKSSTSAHEFWTSLALIIFYLWCIGYRGRGRRSGKENKRRGGWSIVTGTWITAQWRQRKNDERNGEGIAKEGCLGIDNYRRCWFVCMCQLVGPALCRRFYLLLRFCIWINFGRVMFVIGSGKVPVPAPGGT